MSALEGARPRRRKLNFWVQIGVEFLVVVGVGFASQFSFHESARSSLSFALALAFALTMYHLGYREGRKDYEPAHPDAVMPPPKQR
jgi:drug/metabolite transporter (DMT)-like permease